MIGHPSLIRPRTVIFDFLKPDTIGVLSPMVPVSSGQELYRTLLPETRCVDFN